MWQALCCKCFHYFLSEVWIMQKGPGVQIKQSLEVPEHCTHTYQRIELIPRAGKQPAINAESGEHWNIVRLEHNLFCKNETNYYLLQFTAGLIYQLYRSPFWEQILPSNPMSRIQNRRQQDPLYWRNVISSAQTSLLQNQNPSPKLYRQVKKPVLLSLETTCKN